MNADERRSGLFAFIRGQRDLLLVLVDIVISVPHTLNLLSILVGNLNAKLFFKTHHEFDRVQRVGAEVVDKSRIRRDLVLIHTQLVDDNLFYLVLDLLIGHRVCSSVSLLNYSIYLARPALVVSKLAASSTFSIFTSRLI